MDQWDLGWTPAWQVATGSLTGPLFQFLQPLGLEGGGLREEVWAIFVLLRSQTAQGLLFSMS